MLARPIRCLVALVASGAIGLAAAEIPSTSCHVPPSEAHPLTDRDGTLSRYEKLPQHCLKAMFMRCSAEASSQMLDLGSAAVCSIGYEALLRQGFAGNFQALMSWWRTERDRSAVTN